MTLGLSEIAKYNSPKSLSEIAREQELERDNELRRKSQGKESSESVVVNVCSNYGNAVQIGIVNGGMHISKPDKKV